LIYNPQAGGSAEDQSQKLQDELEKNGFRPTYRITRSEEELDRVLPQAKGLIVVVGGDGTLRAVVTRVADRDLPLALLPNGTANNVGRTLGITGDPVSLISQLVNPRKTRVDVGRVITPWGESFFLEGAGVGLYADALARYKPEDGKSFLRGCKTLVDMLTDTPSHRLRMRIDGEELEGEYLLVEAMNMGAIGPRLRLAPNCDPSDGLLELLLVQESERATYLDYLRALISGDFEAVNGIETRKAEKLEIEWDGIPLHQDASYLDLSSELSKGAKVWVTLETMPRCLEFWLPEN